MAKRYRVLSENTLEVTDNAGNSSVFNRVTSDENGNPITQASVNGDDLIRYEYSFYKRAASAPGGAAAPIPSFSDDTFDL